MATVKVIHYHYKKYKDGSSPIMIRVTKNKKPQYFKIGDEKFNVFEKQWDSDFSLLKRDKRLNPDYEKQNAYIAKKKAEVVKIVSDFEEKKIPWTFFMLEEKFKSELKTENVSQFIEGRIKHLKESERFGSAKTVEGTLELLRKSNPSFDKLHFPDINIEFVEKFEKYLQVNRNYKSNSTGIVMRDLRGILNDAINQGVGCKESYPFSKVYGAQKVYKISKLNVKTRHRFITKDFLIKLSEAEFEELHLTWAKNLFLFSFFSSGINFKDMAVLTKDNIKKRMGKEHEETYIYLLRAKTGAPIEIPVTNKVRTLLNWFEANYPNKKNYLIPIITNHAMSGENLHNHLISRRKRLNKHLKTIATKLEFPDAIKDISSYFSRHSYATSMLRNGESVEKISQALGHTDIKTTQIYLGGFELNDISTANDSLLD